MKKELTIICLGDSLTAGSPGFSGYGTWRGNIKSQYEYWLEQRILADFPDLDLEIINFGVGGNTLWQMLYRFKNDVLRIVPEPDIVILMGGINDILGHGSHEPGVIKDLEELYDAIVESDAYLVPVEIGPCTVTHRYIERIKKSNEGIHKLATLMEIPFVPLYTALQDDSGIGLRKEFDIGDGVHYSVKGYEKIGNTIYESVIKKFIESDQ